MVGGGGGAVFGVTIRRIVYFFRCCTTVSLRRVSDRFTARAGFPPCSSNSQDAADGVDERRRPRTHSRASRRRLVLGMDWVLQQDGGDRSTDHSHHCGEKNLSRLRLFALRNLSCEFPLTTPKEVLGGLRSNEGGLDLFSKRSENTFFFFFAFDGIHAWRGAASFVPRSLLPGCNLL